MTRIKENDMPSFAEVAVLTIIFWGLLLAIIGAVMNSRRKKENNDETNRTNSH